MLQQFIYIVSTHETYGETMNNLIIVGIMTVLVVAGFAMIAGASKTATANGINSGKGALANGTGQLPPIVDGKQDIYLKATQYGTYSPGTLKVKKGIPVRIHFSADFGAGCGHAIIIPEYNIRTNAPGEGETLLEFTPLNVGTFPFHCSMKMFNGTIEVVA